MTLVDTSQLNRTPTPPTPADSASASARARQVLAIAFGSGSREGNPARDGANAGPLVIDSAGGHVYQSDAFTLAKAAPAAVVFPRSTDEVSRTVRALTAAGIPVVARGSGTGLAGGSAPFGGGVLLSTSRMTRVFSVSPSNRSAHVEAGVLNGALNDLLSGDPSTAHLHFAPDPSSARASTLGGNAATNAGGVHTLKDFVTSNHVAGVTMVMPDGDVLTTGGLHGTQSPGPFDLAALLCGSEGTLGILTELHLRLAVKRPDWRTLTALFDSTRDACDAVSAVIADGLLPAAMEMLDGTMIKVLEDAYHFGIPASTRAMLVVELDGSEAALLDDELARVEAIMREHRAGEVRSTRDPAERAKLWKARKSAFGAIGKLSHSYCTQDACVPRSRLGDVLDATSRVGEKYGLTISNVFHAGDGNVHPIFLYDDRDPAQVARAMAACAEVLQAAIDVGGTITGEHGVGVEKVGLMPRLFDRPTLATFESLRQAFDPAGLLNPGKLLPSAKHDYAVIRPVG